MRKDQRREESHKPDNVTPALTAYSIILLLILQAACARETGLVSKTKKSKGGEGNKQRRHKQEGRGKSRKGRGRGRRRRRGMRVGQSVILTGDRQRQPCWFGSGLKHS